MKKAVSMVLVLGMILSLCACGGSKFKEEYTALVDELNGMVETCDYAAQVLADGWKVATDRRMDALVRQVAVGGFQVAISLGQYATIAEAKADSNMSDEKAYEGLVMAARAVNPEHWHGTDKYGQYADAAWNQEAEDETMAICNRLNKLLNYSDSGISDRIIAFAEENEKDHPEECQRLKTLLGAVGLYTLELLNPSQSRDEFMGNVAEYQKMIQSNQPS